MAALHSLYKDLIIVVLGSTATGKSKLGIELAKKFNGEIISADSMQVCKFKLYVKFLYLFVINIHFSGLFKSLFY